MSFARMGCEGSDVYVYEYCSGGIACQWCQLYGTKGTWFAKDAEEMIGHLEDHRAEGDTVPDSAFEQLRESGL